MKIFQSTLLVSTLAALFIAGCETLPEAQWLLIWSAKLWNGAIHSISKKN